MKLSGQHVSGARFFGGYQANSPAVQQAVTLALNLSSLPFFDSPAPQPPPPHQTVLSPPQKRKVFENSAPAKRIKKTHREAAERDAILGKRQRGGEEYVDARQFKSKKKRTEYFQEDDVIEYESDDDDLPPPKVWTEEELASDTDSDYEEPEFEGFLRIIGKRKARDDDETGGEMYRVLKRSRSGNVRTPDEEETVEPLKTPEQPARLTEKRKSPDEEDSPRLKRVKASVRVWRSPPKEAEKVIPGQWPASN